VKSSSVQPATEAGLQTADTQMALTARGPPNRAERDLKVPDCDVQRLRHLPVVHEVVDQLVQRAAVMHDPASSAH
jgi:hypothetical protein